MRLQEADIGCPYCGETISVLLNPDDTDQHYIEDCQVCCRPIECYVYACEDGHLGVVVSTDAE